MCEFRCSYRTQTGDREDLYRCYHPKVHRASGKKRLLTSQYQKAQSPAGKAMQAVFKESDPVMVCEAYHVAIDEIAKLSKKAATLLEEAESDVLA